MLWEILAIVGGICALVAVQCLCQLRLTKPEIDSATFAKLVGEEAPDDGARP